MGVVGNYDAADYRVYDRDSRVICRTARGLEWGSVICHVDECHLPDDGHNIGQHAGHGDLLRAVTPDDELILSRLERFRDRAYNACIALLEERSVSATLVDVEHLFDGESLYFYYFGEVNQQVEAITAELAELYDRKVKFRKFAETLASGCGPTCGTSESGCASGGCGSCALAGGCGSKPSKPEETAADSVSRL